MTARLLAALLLAPGFALAAGYPWSYQRVQVAEGIHAFIEPLESVMAQARAAYRAGMNAAELRKLIDLKAFRARIAGDNAMIGANFDHMIGDLAVGRAWQELAGRWEPEGLPR